MGSGLSFCIRVSHPGDAADYRIMEPKGQANLFESIAATGIRCTNRTITIGCVTRMHSK